MSEPTPARRCAFAVVRRVFEQGAYADRAFHAEASGLEPRERSLAMRIAYGAVQRRATLDHVTEVLSGRPMSRLDPPVRAALQVGLVQLLYLDGVADHAAVTESVELAKRAGSAGSGLVNAVLRRATREGPALIAALNDDHPAGAALRHSLPLWLCELWFRELGAEEARALMGTVNEPAESALRVNTLTSSLDGVLGALPVGARPVPGLPEALILTDPFDVQASELWRAGAVMPQSRGSMAVARTLAPEPGATVLDLCAAPGAKTTHLAALTQGQSEIVAVEQHPGRAQALRHTCQRMQAGRVAVAVADAAEVGARGGRFAAVLADPPCSGLGTLASRPDLRWRTSPERITELAALQSAVLSAAALSTAPGGTLVYSVCTVSRAESEDVITAFLERQERFSLASAQRVLPHRDATDGFFIARLERDA